MATMKPKQTFKEKVLERLDMFFKGFTAFHLVGFLMMFYGGRIGERGGYSGYGFSFSLTLAELAGFVTFFIPLIKAWRESRKAAKAEHGP